MKDSSLSTTWPAPLNPVPFANVMEAVTALTAVHLNRLAIIAARRLDRLAAHPPGQRLRGQQEPMDFVSESILLVLQGAAFPGQGRRTKARHLESLETFFNFMQAIVQSCISSQLKTVQRQGGHLSLGPAEPGSRDVDPTDSTNVAAEVSQRETLEQLFGSLREHCQDNPAMLASIALWEADGSGSDRIPKGTLNDKGVHAIRKQAREILRGMAVRDGTVQPTGRELLGP